MLSFYYSPDLSAGSFRTTALVQALLSKLPNDTTIDVITTLPNRYSGFSSDAPSIEDNGRVNIRRIKLPTHKSGMFDQSKAFIWFALQVLRYVYGRQYSLVYATSSRLMTAFLGAVIARQKKSVFYVDIRDIFIDTVGDILPRTLVVILRPFLSFMEKFVVSSAHTVNLVSAGFKQYFLSRYPNAKYVFFTNGIDSEFIDSISEEVVTSNLKAELSVLYAGNIGEGQGLHLIIPALAKRFEGRLKFKIIGDGGRIQQLKEALQLMNCQNVELLAPVKREALIDHYKNADILFLHLNDYEAFHKVLPSKLFEYAAMGKPMWAGVAGYPAEFVKNEIENAVVFQPCNDADAEEAFSHLSMKTLPRNDFVEKFARSNIMSRMADDIILAQVEKKS